MTFSQISIIILAAGKGTRMKSEQAKVLHEVFFSPMIHHVVKAVLPLHPEQTVVIVGHQQNAVKQVLSNFDVDFAIQDQQLGTGHAVLIAEQTIKNDVDTVMILCGDTPLIQTETLAEIYRKHREQKATLTLMTTLLDDPTNYGRILSTSTGELIGIVEQRDATPEQLEIREINAGIYCVEKEFLFSALKNVDTANSQHEIYLTDIVRIAVDKGLPVEKYTTRMVREVLGVNSRLELAEAHMEMQARRNRELLIQGVSMYNPSTSCISPDSTVGKDTLLESCVRITDGSQVGESCAICQGVILSNCRVGDHVTIGPYSCLSDTIVESGTILPAYSRNS